VPTRAPDPDRISFGQSVGFWAAALGATEHVRHDGWGVLRAPGGHLLCVVPVQSDRALFEATARTWHTDV
jgi:hypothetical protein